MGCKALNFKLAIHFNDISIARTGNFTMYAFGPFSRKRSHILLLTCIYACVFYCAYWKFYNVCVRSLFAETIAYTTTYMYQCMCL